MSARETVTFDELLVCPYDREPLASQGDELVCAAGHAFPCPGGVPVLLTDDLAPTHPVLAKSMHDAREPPPTEPGVAQDEVDPMVQEAIAATGGSLYRHLVGSLPRYPIPDLRLPEGHGRLFLDVGSSWGRWCIAASRLGYRPVGIDPSLEAIRAARRVARSLGVSADFLVADARQLPFRDDVFDVAFSYSVFQHFAKENTCAALHELRRVLRPGGTSLVQMANRFGIRSIANQLGHRLRGAEELEFRVRYWTPSELRRTFARELGPSQVEVDGFFSLNAQAADLDLMPRHLRTVVRASDAARAASRVVPSLSILADSLYVRSVAA